MRALIVYLTILALLFCVQGISSADIITPLGPNKVKFSAQTSHYISGDTAGSASSVPAIGDELRAVIRVDSLHVPDQAAYWYNNLSTGEELTGLFHDLVLTRVVAPSGLPAFNMMTGLPNPGTELYYSPEQWWIDQGQTSNSNTPNPLLTDNVGTGGSGDIGSFAGVSGGVVQFYRDTTPDAQGSVGASGPNAWTSGSGTPDIYPNISDGSLWMSGVFLDLSTLGLTGAMQGEVYKIQFVSNVTGNVFGIGGGFLNVFDGELGNVIDTSGVFGPSADMTFISTVTFVPGPSDGWQASADDPARFNTIPEPATLLLLGTGLMSLTGVLRHRRG